MNNSRPNDEAVFKVACDVAASQLCLGLHAADEKGVLHRDVKPANVMIDGRGKLLTTDLAELNDQVRSEDIRSRTSAFMSTEQLAWRELTERSDIYSKRRVSFRSSQTRPYRQVAVFHYPFSTTRFPRKFLPGSIPRFQFGE